MEKILKLKKKFDFADFKKTLSSNNSTDIFDLLKKQTKINILNNHGLNDEHYLDFFLKILDERLDYSPFISLFQNNEPMIYAECEYGLLKLKSDDNKKFKNYLLRFNKFDHEDKKIDDMFIAYNLFKENEDINYQNLANHIYENIKNNWPQINANTIQFHVTDGVEWSKEKLTSLIQNKDIKFIP